MKMFHIILLIFPLSIILSCIGRIKNISLLQPDQGIQTLRPLIQSAKQPPIQSTVPPIDEVNLKTAPNESVTLQPNTSLESPKRSKSKGDEGLNTIATSVTLQPNEELIEQSVMKTEDLGTQLMISAEVSLKPNQLILEESQIEIVNPANKLNIGNSKNHLKKLTNFFHRSTDKNKKVVEPKRMPALKTDKERKFGTEPYDNMSILNKIGKENMKIKVNNSIQPSQTTQNQTSGANSSYRNNITWPAPSKRHIKTKRKLDRKLAALGIKVNESNTETAASKEENNTKTGVGLLHSALKNKT